MTRVPTSVTSLKVFEAAARYLNFSRAAEELCLTQSAVSKQIHALEEQLGTVLFLRVPQGLVLTDAGRYYADAVRPILEQLVFITSRVRDFSNNPDVLNLGVSVTLAQKWLVPRFPSFAKANPTVRINIMPRMQGQRDILHLDAEIRSGEEPFWGGLVSDYVIGREYVVTCAPSLSAQLLSRSPAEVIKQTLMEHAQIPTAWSDWAKAVDLKETLADQLLVAASRYEAYSVMIPAIVAGMGFGIVPLFLVLDELRRGELVIPVAQSLMRKGYSLIYREEKRNLPVLDAFRTWLLAEAQKTESECAELRQVA